MKVIIFLVYSYDSSLSIKAYNNKGPRNGNERLVLIACKTVCDILDLFAGSFKTPNISFPKDSLKLSTNGALFMSPEQILSTSFSAISLLILLLSLHDN